ncbi:MAG: hypothetical protein ACSLE8_06215 [Rhodococcus sp. (in: high G+C Gram-positive bacteria)]
MKTVWTVDHIDYDTPEQAIAIVEAKGSGSVVKFYLERNLVGLLPEFIHRSLSLWSYEDGIWHSHYIYDGHGGKLAVERPH